MTRKNGNGITADDRRIARQHRSDRAGWFGIKVLDHACIQCSEGKRDCYDCQLVTTHDGTPEERGARFGIASGELIEAPCGSCNNEKCPGTIGQCLLEEHEVLFIRDGEDGAHEEGVLVEGEDFPDSVGIMAVDSAEIGWSGLVEPAVASHKCSRHAVMAETDHHIPFHSPKKQAAARAAANRRL